MKEPIRYSKEELRSFQWISQAEEGQWEKSIMPESAGPTLFQQLCNPQASTYRPRKNSRKRQRGLIAALEAAEPSESRMQQKYAYEEDSDGDEVVSLQRLAFLVEGEPDFESGPPQDGFEYLRRVMWETARCPKVKIAKISEEKLISKQTNYMPEIPPIPACAPGLLPTKAWVQAFLGDFSDLRAVLAATSTSHEDSLVNLPHIHDKVMWKSLCFGQVRSDAYVFDELQEDGKGVLQPSRMACRHVAQSPCLKILLRLNEVSRATLFRYHVSWLKEQGNVAYDRAMWLFALSATLDCPLDDETSAAFRDLLRKCAKLRMEKTAQDEELYMLNILITIAGAYFGQAESSSVING